MQIREFCRTLGVIPFFGGAVIISSLSISGSLFGEPFSFTIHSMEFVG